MSLDTYLEQKQQKLTNAINSNGIQLMINNTSLKTISLKNSTSIGQISGGILYENQNGYLNILQSSDNSNIIFDFNSDKLVSNYQPLLSSTNKLNSDYVNVNGITLSNSFLNYQTLISNYNNANAIKLMNGDKLKNISVNNGVVSYDIPNNIATYSNGIMKISEAGNSNIIFDIDTTSLQTKLSTTNKLSSDFITGLSTITTNITNANNVNGCNLISNNTIKNLSVLFPTTTIDGVNNIIHKNSYLTLTESSDNSNIIIDINNSYLNTTTSLSSLFYTQASTNSILTNSYYTQASTNSILNAQYYSQLITNSLLSTKQNFISTNSTLNLTTITCSTAFTCQGLKVLSNSGQEVLISPGVASSGGGVGITNLCSYPLMMQAAQTAATNLTTLTTSWSILKNITPYQSVVNANYYHGLNPNALAAGFFQSVNGGRYVSIDGILALLVGFNQAMYNQLKTAGVSGFV
jgi:hypothetical protein